MSSFYNKDKVTSKLIALDTLQQVWNNKFIPTRSVFVAASLEAASLDKSETTVKWQDLLKKTENCEVCAIGALAASSILKNNGLKITEKEHSCYRQHASLSFKRVVNRLKKYFLKEEVIGMEVCFEKGNGAFVWTVESKENDPDNYIFKRNIIKNYKLSKAQVKFIDDCYDLGRELRGLYYRQWSEQDIEAASKTGSLSYIDHNTLVYIMKNILLHDGYFKPKLIDSII